MELRVSLGWAGRAEQALAELAQHGPAWAGTLCPPRDQGWGGCEELSQCNELQREEFVEAEQLYCIFRSIFIYT